MKNEKRSAIAGQSEFPPPSEAGLRWRAWPCAACSGGCAPHRYLRASIQAGAALAEDPEHPEQVAASQSQALIDWVSSCRHSHWIPFTLKLFAEGSEHLAYFDSETAMVWKLTRPRVFGENYFLVNGLIHQRNSSPCDYLTRLRLWKLVFQSAPKAVGVTNAGQIVSAHHFISGVSPSQDAVDQFLLEAGLKPRKQAFWIWKKSYREFDIWVGDARTDNFVQSPSGIVPIDLRLWMTVPE